MYCTGDPWCTCDRSNTVCHPLQRSPTLHFVLVVSSPTKPLPRNSYHPIKPRWQDGLSKSNHLPNLPTFTHSSNQPRTPSKSISISGVESKGRRLAWKTAFCNSKRISWRTSGSLSVVLQYFNASLGILLSSFSHSFLKVEMDIFHREHTGAYKAHLSVLTCWRRFRDVPD